MRSEQGKAALHKYRDSKKAKMSRRRYRQQNKEQINARARVWAATQSGRLPKPSTLPCSSCGKPAEEYHHHNGYGYDSALDVLPICTHCHYALRVIR